MTEQEFESIIIDMSLSADQKILRLIRNLDERLRKIKDKEK